MTIDEAIQKAAKAIRHAYSVNGTPGSVDGIAALIRVELDAFAGQAKETCEECRAEAWCFSHNCAPGECSDVHGSHGWRIRKCPSCRFLQSAGVSAIQAQEIAKGESEIFADKEGA